MSPRRSPSILRRQRLPLPAKPGRPQTSKHGEKGYTRTANKTALRQASREHD